LSKCLLDVLNVSIDDSQWLQDTLPIKDGGIGIRQAIQLAPSTFLASATGTSSLVSTILPSDYSSIPDPAMPATLQAWMTQGGSTPPLNDDARIQRKWDKCLTEHTNIRNKLSCL